MVNDSDVTGQDFVGTHVSSILGRVTDSSTGMGIAGVFITLSGSGSIATDVNGIYSFTNIPNGSYTIAPSPSSYTFSPQNITVTVNDADITGQDFVGTHVSSILGRVTEPSTIMGIAGVTMTLSGSGSGSITTDVNGIYSFTNIPNGSYTITPSKTGYSFLPQSITVTMDNFDMTGQDFVGTSQNWHWRNPLPQGNTLAGVTYGNGTFVAVGFPGVILTSPDGVMWTSRDSGTFSSLSGVTYCGRRSKRTGNGGTESVADGASLKIAVRINE